MVPSRRRFTLLLAATLVLAAAATLAFVLLRDSGSGLSSVSPNSVGVIDPASNELVGEVRVGLEPVSIAAGEGGVWVASTTDAAISKLDPAARSLTGTIPVGDYPSDVVVGAGSVWVALGGFGQLRNIEPKFNETGKPVTVFPTPRSSAGPTRSDTHVAFGDGSIWYLSGLSTVGRFDLGTGSARQVGAEEFLLILQRGASTVFTDIAYGLGSIWLTNRAGNSVTELDPGTDRVASQITVGAAPSAIALFDGTLWVANLEDDTVSRIDLPTPESDRGVTVQVIPVGDGPVDVAVDDTGVWVANSLDRTVSRIDPETNEVVATIEIRNVPQRIAAGEGAVWVTVQAPPEEGE